VTNDLGRTHVRKGSSIQYAYCPPASGTHYEVSQGVPLERGLYDTGGTPPGSWVHNLEHGYMVLAYSCGVDGKSCPGADEMAALRRFFDEAPTTPGAQTCGIPNKLIVVRFDDMATRYALLGWDRALLTDTFDPEQAKAFAFQVTDGPAAPEPGAC
jgi:Protein of unknown function (DUF3105)